MTLQSRDKIMKVWMLSQKVIWDYCQNHCIRIFGWLKRAQQSNEDMENNENDIRSRSGLVRILATILIILWVGQKELVVFAWGSHFPNFIVHNRPNIYFYMWNVKFGFAIVKISISFTFLSFHITISINHPNHLCVYQLHCSKLQWKW